MTERRSPAVLITQCLQDDFVKSIGRYDPLPNTLHVGFEEARRLMGHDPATGPVGRVMRWAHGRPADELRIIHIRDWHDPADPRQASHLQRFGPHCLKGTDGARFAFDPAGGRADVVDSLTLNDFQGTRLAGLLEPLAAAETRVGLVGVWTEAKVSYLAYELATRYPGFRPAVCSALTASSSRSQHFLALDRLRKLLGVEVHESIGDFLRFLGGEEAEEPLELPAGAGPALAVDGRGLGELDLRLVRYLFRDSKDARLKTLDGGFSGNVVLGAESRDPYGHAQVPHVVKIGPRALIGRERAAFERIESVLGNNAPHIADFADLGERGAIKYRYAAMGGGFSTTFQKRFCAGLSLEKTRRVLSSVFLEQLGRFYRAATRERTNLLEHYQFSPSWAPSVRKKVEAVLGPGAARPVVEFEGGREVPNLCRFYESELERVLPLAEGSAYFSYVHGDLNGANVILDSQENVWLIDFFHAHRGHVLRDLIKLENDLLYIFTPVREETLPQALALTDLLLGVEDLGRPLPGLKGAGVSDPKLTRAYKTVGILRSFYPGLVHADRSPLQLLIGQLRYAAHTLGFDESSPLQKRWALYAASACAARIAERLRSSGPLRVDWLDERLSAPGRLGITLLPGRKDYRRSLRSDLAALKAAGVTHAACLLPASELAQFGVERLLERYGEAGIEARSLPILDQRVSTPAEMRDLVGWARERTAAGGRVVFHCAGGLGRAGMAAACYLRAAGAGADEAIREVRRARTERAIETSLQEEFIRRFEP